MESEGNEVSPERRGKSRVSRTLWELGMNEAVVGQRQSERP